MALLAAVALSCGPALPDKIVEGRWVRYRYWSDDGPPCPEAVQQIDRFVEQVSARLGRPSARIDYFKLRSLAELQKVPQCAIPHAGGCAIDGTVYAITWTQDHEVTHAVASRLGYPPQLFVEGLAVVNGCGPARFSGAPLDEVDLAALVDNTAWAKELSWPTYLQAAAFTRFLIDRGGQAAFNGFYEATAHGADSATLDARMTAAFGLTVAEALAEWRAGPAPREGEACLPFDDVCEGAADLALTSVGASGQFEGTVSCVDLVAGLEVGPVPTVRLRFGAEQDGRALSFRPCDRTGSAARNFVYSPSMVSGLSGRFIDWWAPLSPGRYSLTVSRTPLPLTQLDTQAPVGGSAIVSGSAHPAPWAASCTSDPVPVGDDTGILLLNFNASDAGVVRLAPGKDRPVDSLFTSALAVPPWLCGGCGPPPGGCTQLVNPSTPGARLLGASSLWLQPESGAASFSIELVLGPP